MRASAVGMRNSYVIEATVVGRGVEEDGEEEEEEDDDLVGEVRRGPK